MDRPGSVVLLDVRRASLPPPHRRGRRRGRRRGEGGVVGGAVRRPRLRDLPRRGFRAPRAGEPLQDARAGEYRAAHRHERGGAQGRRLSGVDRARPRGRRFDGVESGRPADRDRSQSEHRPRPPVGRQHQRQGRDRRRQVHGDQRARRVRRRRHHRRLGRAQAGDHRGGAGALAATTAYEYVTEHTGGCCAMHGMGFGVRAGA